MDTEQSALFEALDLARYQQPTLEGKIGLAHNSLMR
jgi:hypothetical protein